MIFLVWVFLSRTVRIVRRHIIHSLFGAIIASFSLAIIRDSDASSSCPARIETLSVVSPALTLSPARAVDRFSAVFSASARSLP
jgi:hypothetical protein